MTDNLQLLRIKLRHLHRMQDYLAYSLSQVSPLLAMLDWGALTDDQHESLAAFRVRFGEMQEHLGKAMRAVAIEEEVDVDRFGAVLAHMERLGVLDSVQQWKLMRELRNSVNHEYEDDEARQREFFALMVDNAPRLSDYLTRLADYCSREYGIAP